MYKMEVGDIGCLLRICDSCTSDCLEAAAALLSGVRAEARLFLVASKRAATSVHGRFTVPLSLLVLISEGVTV